MNENHGTGGMKMTHRSILCVCAFGNMSQPAATRYTCTLRWMRVCILLSAHHALVVTAYVTNVCFILFLFSMLNAIQMLFSMDGERRSHSTSKQTILLTFSWIRAVVVVRRRCRYVRIQCSLHTQATHRRTERIS